MPRDIYSEEEKTDDFFLYKTVKTLSSFHIFCLLTKNMYMQCSGKRIVQFSSYAFALDTVGLLGFDI